MSIDCGYHDKGPITVRRDPDNGCSDLDALVGLYVPVAFDYKWRPTGAHADDELVIETAVNGQADALATFNWKHMREAGVRFGFQVQRPGPLVRRLRSTPARAKARLNRLGTQGQVRDDDRLDAPDKPA